MLSFDFRRLNNQLFAVCINIIVLKLYWERGRWTVWLQHGIFIVQDTVKCVHYLYYVLKIIENVDDKFKLGYFQTWDISG